MSDLCAADSVLAYATCARTEVLFARAVRTAEGALVQAPRLPAAHPEVATTLWHQKSEVWPLHGGAVTPAFGAHDCHCCWRHWLACADGLQVCRKNMLMRILY